MRVIQNIGMARIDPIMYNGVEIVPIQFLKAVLPNPGDLCKNYTGETSIGCRIRGIGKDGKELTYYGIIIVAIMLPISKPEHRV